MIDFNQIWDEHEKYQKYGLVPNNKEFWEGDEPFKGYKAFMVLSALIHEAVETQRETQWKWWKKPKPIDMEKLIDEIADLQHFVVQLAMICGISKERFLQQYYDKLQVNIKRLEDGY